MSSNAKKNNNKQDDKKILEELVNQIDSMVADRDKKCEYAKTQLVEQLKVTADKYRTANGVMQAVDILHQIVGDSHVEYNELNACRNIAKGMSVVALNMAEVANDLKWESMDKLCDGFYDPEFADKDSGVFELVEEMMRLQLCQNVGSIAEEIPEFLKSMNEQIDEVRKKLEEL